MKRPVLIVAATSARMLAESARRGGLRPVALDLFGDTDTRRAGHWIGIANARRSAIDTRRMQVVLTRMARVCGVIGWVAGGGFEDRVELVRECAGRLPLIGNGAEVIARSKLPEEFFSMLDRFDIPHPESRLTAPAAAAGWLRKRAGATGGGHVRRLEGQQSAPVRSGTYYQREAAGVPMSALFLADGTDALLVGFNRQLVAPGGDRPFVFQGAVGPVAVPGGVERELRQAIGRITRHLGLIGLNSLDFLLDAGQASVLEINPRPSATMTLHDGRLPGGLMAAHVAACRERSLPRDPLPASSTVNGYRIVYARRPSLATSSTQSYLQRLGWCHDIGPVGTRTARGEPVCSVSAAAGDAAAAIAQLAQREREIQQLLEDDDGN